MAQEHFPNLPKTPPTAAETAAANAATAAAAAAKVRAAKSVKMMYLWIGMATAAFGGIAYWGMLSPAPTDAVPPAEIIVPGTQTAAQRAEEQALTDMIKKMKEQQESRVIVLEGPRTPVESTEPKAPETRNGTKDFVIKFSPATRPSTRPATIGGRTKPFLAPDVAEDGSFFGQIDKATGKPKTVYSSNLRKYVVDSGMDFADRDESGSVIKRPENTPSTRSPQIHEAEARPARTAAPESRNRRTTNVQTATSN